MSKEATARRVCITDTFQVTPVSARGAIGATCKRFSFILLGHLVAFSTERSKRRYMKEEASVPHTQACGFISVLIAVVELYRVPGTLELKTILNMESIYALLFWQLSLSYFCYNGAYVCMKQINTSYAEDSKIAPNRSELSEKIIVTSKTKTSRPALLTIYFVLRCTPQQECRHQCHRSQD